MKIEICESLLQSWLKHIKLCNIIQMNYKISSEWQGINELVIDKLYEDVSNEFRKIGIEIFKKNASWKQLLKQSETDLVGLKIFNNTVSECYFVEVAFHENGLNYGSKETTIANVLKKMIRALFIQYSQFGSLKGNIIFATPKMNCQDKIEDGIALLKNIVDYNLKGNNFNFEIYANSKFESEIMKPVLHVAKNNSDTTELFLRSYQLINMFRSNSDSIVKDTKINLKDKTSNIPLVNDMSISVEKRKVPCEKNINNDVEDKVAYYFSRFEHNKIFPQYNQTQAFEIASRKLNIKLTTLRNKRDSFDPFVNKIKTRGNKRAGWHQKDKLSDDMQRVFTEYLSKSEEEIEKEVRAILEL